MKDTRYSSSKKDLTVSKESFIFVKKSGRK